jgi:hypothetical protein
MSYEEFRRDDERFRRYLDALDAQDAQRRRVAHERAIAIAAREKQAKLWTLRVDLLKLGRAAGMADAFMWAQKLIRRT